MTPGMYAESGILKSINIIYKLQMTVSKKILITIIICCASPLYGQVNNLDALRYNLELTYANFKHVQEDSIAKTDSLYIIARQAFLDAYYSYNNAKSDSAEIAIECYLDSVYLQSSRFVGATKLGKGNHSVIKISNDSIFVNKARILYCIDTKTGNVLWNKDMSGFHGDFIVSNQHIIAQKMIDKKIFAINKKDGKLSWSIDSSRIVPQISNFHEEPPFIERKGQLFEVNWQTGHLDSLNLLIPYACISSYAGYIISEKKGTIYCYNKKRGKKIWEKSGFRNIYMYAVNNELIIKSDSLWVINIKTGKVKSQKVNNDYSRIYYTTSLGYINLTGEGCAFTNIKDESKNWAYKVTDEEEILIPLNSKNYCNNEHLFLSGKENKNVFIRMFNANTGEFKWEFQVYSSIDSNIVESNGVLYFVNYAGYIVAIDIDLKDGIQKWQKLITNNSK